MKVRWRCVGGAWSLTGVMLISAGLIACGNGSGDSGGDSASSTGNSSTGSSSTGNSSGDSSEDDGGDGVKTLIGVTQIPGGGQNAAPLAPGCGPETAHDCTEPGGSCNSDALIRGGEVEVVDAGASCFFGQEAKEPSATVEHITEVVAGEEYVHIRVIFDPNFVDTVYGECSFDTGWTGKKGHTFKDLKGSDHVELMLYDCSDELSMHMKVDFIDDEAPTTCGYATAGVKGGDGEMFVGDPEDVLAVGTSLDRNMNGCGYCNDMESPCPSDELFAPSDEAPEWDFRMVYELWIDADAFGSAGFCRPDIEYVHASPAKAKEHTVLVEPGDCPPPPDDECPIDFELFLSSEGEFICGGPPDDDGNCPEGFELDLTSEGELCIEEGHQ